MSDDIVEVVARGIEPHWAEFDEYAELKGWTAEEKAEELAERTARDGKIAKSLKNARAALTALLEHGPSSTMREAGKRAYLASNLHPATDFSVACGIIFEAMLTQALQGEG